MPDPRLVSRAQRAATMLERAWERWRATQGLQAEAMPPVSSYVGYSIEEPWGRPRVVFGVNAEDAERLAALLQESAGYGPEDLPRPPDPGYRPPARGGLAADRQAMPDRGYDQSLLDDVRGRIPVQGWPPEFSDSREQLNSDGPSRPDEPELPLDLGPVQDEEPGRVHGLKPPVELGLSDEFRPADDFLDADEFLADDPRAGGFRAEGSHGEGFRGDLGGRDSEAAASGLDAPYGVPYAGEARYGVPYTGEPYYPDGAHGTAGPGEYGAAGANPAAGGHGEAALYRPADDLVDEREEAAGQASDGAPGPGERPGRDGQPAQPAGPLAGETPQAGAQDVTTATAEVPAGAEPAGDASPDVTDRNEDVPDESGPDEDLRDESAGGEDLRAAALRPGDTRGADMRGADPRGGEVRPSDETPDRDGLPGKHMLASGEPARKDDAGGEPLSRDTPPDQAPRPHDGPVPGPRHGSAPDGPHWPPPGPARPAANGPEGAGEDARTDRRLGSARPSPAGPGEEPPAAAQPAGDVPGEPAASADRPADPASRGSITDTMAAELAGWAAGELPGQAAARLASWATAGGAVARGRQQTRIGGGGTAAERVS